MPVIVEPEVSDTVDRWQAAIPGGVESGLEQAAGEVRDAAKAALAANADPWGAAFPPNTPTTIHFYATYGDPRGSIGPTLRATVENGTRGVVRTSGRARRYAHIKQYGSPNNRMFDNARPAPIPARPYLPIRANGVVDLPPEMSARVIAAINLGLAQALGVASR